MASARTMTEEHRFKTVIIPIINKNYIVVENRNSKNLTFPIGGCKLGEPNLNCAKRELNEETRDSVKFPNKWTKYNNLKSIPRSNREKRKNNSEGKIVKMHPIVYVFTVNQNFKNIKKTFNKLKPSSNAKKQLSETSNILKVTNKNIRTGKMYHVTKNIYNSISTLNRRLM